MINSNVLKFLPPSRMKDLSTVRKSTWLLRINKLLRLLKQNSRKNQMLKSLVLWSTHRKITRSFLKHFSEELAFRIPIWPSCQKDTAKYWTNTKIGIGIWSTKSEISSGIPFSTDCFTSGSWSPRNTFPSQATSTTSEVSKIKVSYKCFGLKLNWTSWTLNLENCWKINDLYDRDYVNAIWSLSSDVHLLFIFLKRSIISWHLFFELYTFDERTKFLPFYFLSKA